MMRHFAYIITMLIVATCAAPGLAQPDDLTYSVSVPPNMTLIPLQGPRLVNHPNSSSDVTFTNSSWLASTASSTGSTVVFKTDTPFRVITNPVYQRNVRLLVKQPFGPGGWVRNVITDESDYANSDPDAQVELSSSSAGFAIILLNVTFITEDVNTLIAGNYDVTVVGTITAN